ncbi:hypothetical protein ACFVYT_24720 [Streptomyces sp. NPDC058290]|uniref:hypothetical protein n=1 Tax=Streptomyces sp. NPDC058290 TaxID=3346426 RepID=UPI0036ED4D43
MSWLWWGLAAWIAFDLAAAAWWARHRSREKRRQEIRDALQAIGRERAREAALERNLTIALAGRRRIVQAALDQIPHQTRRTEEDQ